MRAKFSEEKLNEIKRLRESGMQWLDIAENVQAGVSTIKRWYEVYVTHTVGKGKPQKKEKPVVPKEKSRILKPTLEEGQTVNCDKVYRHCVYGCTYMENKCDYLSKTKKRRPCPHSACTVYVKGNPQSMRSAFGDF